MIIRGTSIWKEHDMKETNYGMKIVKVDSTSSPYLNGDPEQKESWTDD